MIGNQYFLVMDGWMETISWIMGNISWEASDNSSTFLPIYISALLYLTGALNEWVTLRGGGPQRVSFLYNGHFPGAIKQKRKRPPSEIWTLVLRAGQDIQTRG